MVIIYVWFCRQKCSSKILKKEKAWKQFQNKLYIMNVITNGENAKLIELLRHGSFLLWPKCKTLWGFTRWTWAPLLRTLEMRNFFPLTHSTCKGPAEALCCLSAGDSPFTEQLLDMEPKMWLPCVLKKMVSPQNRQTHNNGSFGWELLWPSDRFSLVKNGSTQPAQYHKLRKLCDA